MSAAVEATGAAAAEATVASAVEATVAGSLDRDSLGPEIARVLREAFGDKEISEIAAQRGGLSGALLLSLVVEGKGYVLRRGTPERSAHEIACMRIAAERGVAPAIHHTDAAARITIVERLQNTPAPGPERIARTASTLRRLHEGPAFPQENFGVTAWSLFEGGMRLQADSEVRRELFRIMEQATSAIARFAGSAPCHNDLNPNNMIEAADRLYLVDWETAGNGDPFVDLAETGIFWFPGPKQREALLDAYRDGQPSDEDRARALVARVVALGFYGALFLMGAQAQGPVSLDAPVPYLEMLQSAATTRERTPPGLLAASLLGEMRREAGTDAYEQARRLLAEGG